LTGSTHRVSRVTPGFFFPRFFFNPAQFQPWIGRVPGQPTGPGRVSKLYKKLHHISIKMVLNQEKKNATPIKYC
jgi:hypothetical protein